MKRMLVVSTIAASRAGDEHRSEPRKDTFTTESREREVQLTRTLSAKPAKHGGSATAATARVAVFADVDRCT